MSDTPADCGHDVLDELADHLAALRLPHPVRVAIDGVDGAGKTTFADSLAPRLEARGRTVLRASIDDFHAPRAIRHARGADSPEGYFLDTFDLGALSRELLDPLGPREPGEEGVRTVRTAVHDLRNDLPRDEPPCTVPHDAILLLDGIFLHRDELVVHWDRSVWLEAPFEVTLARAVARDAPEPADRPRVQVRYETRDVPGQRIYLERCRPRERASCVIDVEDPGRLRWLRRPTER